MTSRIRGKVAGSVVIGHVDHHALAVLERGLADESAKRRLMVDGAKSDRPKGRVDFDALGSVDEGFSLSVDLALARIAAALLSIA